MADEIIEKLKQLETEGEKFTYQNFAKKGLYGYPESYTSEYISWRVRVDTLLQKNFGRTSPVYEQFSQGDQISLLGYGTDHFNSAHGYLLGSVKAAVELLNFMPPKKDTRTVPTANNSKVFVVHGHDELLKNQVESFLAEIGLEPIVLHKKPDEGQTIIEKFEKHSDVGYAIILLTPDDIGYQQAEAGKKEEERKTELRARQNVIFEFGHFVGKLGRNRVCCVYKEGLQLPTDVSGMIYKKIQKDLSEVHYAIIKDLKAAGYAPKI